MTMMCSSWFLDGNRKSSVYDVFCTTDDGSRIVVEIQRRKQSSYVERAIYYSTYQIGRQVEAGSKVLEKMTTERDLRNQMAYARKEAIEEGLAEGLEKGLAEGLERGLKEGSRGKAMDIARNLKRMGMSVADIVEAVGLEADIVQGL